VGTYEVRVQAGEGVKLVFDPGETQMAVAQGGTATTNFTGRTSATMSFQCVNSSGNPVPAAEFLLTTHAAGKVPQAERDLVQRAGMNGTCTAVAPAGPVYLMIWVLSSDWNNPDKVFRIELPISGVKDLGAVVVTP
jgi:hypothetical protein